MRARENNFVLVHSHVVNVHKHLHSVHYQAVNGNKHLHRLSNFGTSFYLLFAIYLLFQFICFFFKISWIFSMFLWLKLFDDIRRYYVRRCTQTTEETDVCLCTLCTLDYKMYKRKGSALSNTYWSEIFPYMYYECFLFV